MTDTQIDFRSAFRGSFSGILRWQQLDEFWQILRDRKEDDWYVYAVGEAPPESTVSAEAIARFIEEIDVLLRHKS